MDGMHTQTCMRMCMRMCMCMCMCTTGSRPALTGNILLAAPEGKPLRISFVDAGLAVELSERDRKNFKSFFRALGLGDGRLAAKLMMENATEQQCAE